MDKKGRVTFGIGRKLLFYFLLLSLVPVIVGGSIAFIISRNQLEENTKAHLSDLARDCGRKISYYVSARYQDIKILSQSEVLKGKNREATQAYIDEVGTAYPFYKAISVLDPDGTIIACTRRELIGESRADTPWFQRTRQSAHGEVVPMDAYRAKTAGWEMVIGFNTPITDKEGKQVVGVLATRVNMDHVIARVRVLDERSVGDNHAYLLNRRGEIIAGPDEREFLTAHRLHEFPVVRDLLAGKTGISEYANDRGEDVISARYVLLGDGGFDGWGWGIIVTQPVSEAFKAAYEIRSTMIFLVLIIAILVAIFALFISKRFSRPITEVSRSASRISQGNLEPIKIDYTPRDEIGDLVHAFNTMTEDLHRTTVSRDSLAREIIERKKAEEKIEHLNLVLRAIRNVNRIITKEKEYEMLLKGACNNLIENRGYHNAWIALLDGSGGVVATAEAGLGEDFQPMVELLKSGELPDCVQRSLSQREVVVIEDSASSCMDCPLSGLHHGGGAIAARLEHGDKVYGLLSASIPAAFVTDEEEQGLFKEVAGDIGLALHSLELEKEREQAEDSLKRSEEKLKSILHGSPIPTYVIDKGHRVTHWNRAMEEYSGIEAKDILGTSQHWKAFYDERRPCMCDLIVDGRIDDIPRWYTGKYDSSYLIEGAFGVEDYFPRLGKWLYFTSAPIRDPGGVLIGAVSTNQDVTERKKAEERIKALSWQIIDIQEKERESLSREIHDNIGQLLATLKMGIFRMNKKIPEKLSGIKDQIGELSYLVNKTIREIRGLSHALHPPVIEDLGLTSAIEELCQDFKSYSEIRMNWDIDPIEKPLQSMTNITIYRLFQEGLHNILKHSRATEVRVRLTSRDNTIEAVIEDNGVGFVVDEVLTPTPNKRALGLISMRERLALIGGVLQITSKPGKGTKIVALIDID
jgi:signal transduction histidine kinase/HAMP domain-containing protein